MKRKRYGDYMTRKKGIIRANEKLISTADIEVTKETTIKLCEEQKRKFAVELWALEDIFFSPDTREAT